MISKQELLNKLRTLAANAANERHKAVDCRIGSQEIAKREERYAGICDAIRITEHEANDEILDYEQYLKNLYFYARNEDDKEHAMDELTKLGVKFTVNCMHGREKFDCESCNAIRDLLG